MFSYNDTVATARAGYEDSFDCAQAVALIGFLGLLSNFQDIIETFTMNMTGRRRRRKRSSSDRLLASLSKLINSEQWNALHPVIEMVRWASSKQPHFEMNQSYENNKLDAITNSNSTEDSLFEEEKKESKPKRVTPFVNDIATLGPQIALWLVDVADGRISGDEGHRGVCQTINKLESSHGSSGSVFGNLLTRTVAGALSTHSPAMELLQKASLFGKPDPCLQTSSQELY